MYKIHLYRLDIGLCKFVNKAIRYQIIICNINSQFCCKNNI